MLFREDSPTLVPVPPPARSRFRPLRPDSASWLASRLLPVAIGLSWTLVAEGSSAPAGSHYPTPTPATTRDNQGHVLATDGTRLVVGSPFADDGVGLVKIHQASSGEIVYLLSNPTPSRHDHFGASVAISGNLVAIGCPGESGAANQAGCVHIYDLSSATPQVAVRTLSAPGTVADLQFGRSVALDGSRLVVGACHSDIATPGAAFVFDLAGPTPNLPTRTLLNPGGTEGDGFGGAVAISGDRIAVSAARRQSGAYAAGAVFIYQMTAAMPEAPVITIPAHQAAAFGQFGTAIGLEGTRLVVGAPNDDTHGPNAGSAYCFEIAGSSALLQHIFSPPTVPQRSGFGRSVSVSGNWVVVGHPDSEDPYVGAGGARAFNLGRPTPTAPALLLDGPLADVCFGFGESVTAGQGRFMIGAPRAGADRSFLGRSYIFDPASTTPEQPAAIVNQSSPAREIHFGSVTAADGNLVIVGAPYDDSLGQDSGAVFVYDWTLGPPTTPAAVLFSPEPAPYNHFGASVAIHGTRVVIGVPQSDNGASNAGRAYVFDLQGNSPSLVATLNNPTPAADDTFGGSVAIFGNRVLVGAHRDDTGKSNSGAAYLFDLFSTTPAIPVATIFNPDPDTGDYFGATVAMSATRLAIGCPRESTVDDEAGRVYLYTSPIAGSPTSLGFVQHPLADSGDNFGGSIALSSTYLAVGAFGDDTDLAGDTDEETGTRTGSAFVFDVSGSPASLLTTLSSPGQFDNAGYGASVAARGSRILISAVGRPPGASAPGVVYAYDMTSPSPATAVATVPNPFAGGDSSFGAAVAIGANRIVVGAPTSEAAGPKQGAVHVFQPFFAQLGIELFGAALVPGGSVHMGQSAIGSPKRYHLRLRNTGNGPLTVSELSWSGSGAQRFSTQPPAPLTVPPFGQLVVPVAFSPAVSNPVTATLTVFSDSILNPSFSLQFSGSGILRETLFQSWTSAAGLAGTNAAPEAVPYRDGVANILKYAFNLDGSGPDLDTLVPDTGRSGLPRFSWVAGPGQAHFRLEYLRRKGSGLSYQPKTSSTLANGSFLPMGGSETVVDIDQQWERVVVMEPINPAVVKRRFGKVEVTFP